MNRLTWVQLLIEHINCRSSVSLGVELRVTEKFLSGLSAGHTVRVVTPKCNASSNNLLSKIWRKLVAEKQEVVGDDVTSAENAGSKFTARTMRRSLAKLGANNDRVWNQSTTNRGDSNRRRITSVEHENRNEKRETCGCSHTIVSRRRSTLCCRTFKPVAWSLRVLAYPHRLEVKHDFIALIPWLYANFPISPTIARCFRSYQDFVISLVKSSPLPWYLLFFLLAQLFLSLTVLFALKREKRKKWKWKTVNESRSLLQNDPSFLRVAGVQVR